MNNTIVNFDMCNEKDSAQHIYIVTTRSFSASDKNNDGTLFNKENCTPLNINKSGDWYKMAFPQYFTDIIQFIDINEVEKYILEQSKNRVKSICENQIEELIYTFQAEFATDEIGKCVNAIAVISDKLTELNKIVNSGNNTKDIQNKIDKLKKVILNLRKYKDKVISSVKDEISCDNIKSRLFDISRNIDIIANAEPFEKITELEAEEVEAEEVDAKMIKLEYTKLKTIRIEAVDTSTVKSKVTGKDVVENSGNDLRKSCKNDNALIRFDRSGNYYKNIEFVESLLSLIIVRVSRKILINTKNEKQMLINLVLKDLWQSVNEEGSIKSIKKKKKKKKSNSNDSLENVFDTKVILNVIIKKIISRIVSESIPDWWNKMLNYKNKCLYWEINEAEDCYDYLKNTELFAKAISEHRKELKNQFSLEHPIYKYNSSSQFGEWYVVQCFDMRTDPDFGLKYMISLVKEVTSYISDRSTPCQFHLLIHDYDIGRKLFRSSVLVNKSEYNSVFNDIKFSLAEKELDNIWRDAAFLKPFISAVGDSFGEMIIEQPEICMKNKRNSDYKKYSELIDYLKADDHKDLFEAIKDIIVFKHNKGEVAKMLNNNKVILLVHLFLYMQKLVELRINLMINLDKYLYGTVGFVKIDDSIKEIQEVIVTATRYLDELDSTIQDRYSYNREFIRGIKSSLHKVKIRENDYTEESIKSIVELLNDLNEL